MRWTCTRVGSQLSCADRESIRHRPPPGWLCFPLVRGSQSPCCTAELHMATLASTALPSHRPALLPPRAMSLLA